MSASVNAYQELTGRIIDFTERSAASPRSFTDGSRESFESLSEADQGIAISRTITLFRYGDLAFYQFEMGMLTEQRFESLFTPVLVSICSYQMGLAWSNMRPGFVPSYQEYVDSKIAEC